jgi:hypothetical protein
VQTVNIIASHVSVSHSDTPAVSAATAEDVRISEVPVPIESDVDIPVESVIVSDGGNETIPLPLVALDHARISSIEGCIAQLTALMESFLTGQPHPSTVIAPSLVMGHMSPDSTHPVQARVAMSHL